jgi:hypothetical protein
MLILVSFVRKDFDFGNRARDFPYSYWWFSRLSSASKTTRKRKIIHGASINLAMNSHSVGTQHWSNVWLTGSAKAGPVHLTQSLPLLGIASVNEAPDALNGYGPSNVNAQERRGRCLFLSKMKP